MVSNVESSQQESVEQTTAQTTEQSAQPTAAAQDQDTPMSGVTNYSSATIQQLTSQLHQLTLQTAQQSSMMSQMQQQLWNQHNQQYFNNTNYQDVQQQPLFINVHSLPPTTQQQPQYAPQYTPMSVSYPPPPTPATSNQPATQQQQQQQQNVVAAANMQQRGQPAQTQQSNVNQPQQSNVVAPNNQQASVPVSMYSGYDLKRRDQLLRTAPKYFGNANENVDVFLLTMRRYFQGAHVVNQQEQYEVLLWSTRGKAQTYVQSLYPQPMSIYALEQALRRRFGKTERQYLQEFHNVKQTHNQSIADYGDLLRQVSMGTNLTECAIIHQFLDQLQDKRLIPHLTLQHFNHLEEAVAAASILAQRMPSVRTIKSTPSKVTSTTTTATQKKAVKCYNCKQLGHLSKDCPKKSKSGSKKNVNSFEMLEDELDSATNEDCQDEIDTTNVDPENDDCEDVDEFDESGTDIEEVDNVEFDCSNVDVNVAKKQQDKARLFNKLKASGVQKGKQPQPLPRTTNVPNTNNQQPPKPTAVFKKVIKPAPGAYLDVPNVVKTKLITKRPQKYAPTAALHQPTQATGKPPVTYKPTQIVPTLQPRNQVITQTPQAIDNQKTQAQTQVTQHQKVSKPASSQFQTRSTPQISNYHSKYLFKPAKSLSYNQQQPAPMYLPRQKDYNKQQSLQHQAKSDSKQLSSTATSAQSTYNKLSSRAPVYPTTKINTRIVSNNTAINKLLQTQVALPLDVQLGLLSLSNKQDLNLFVTKCQNKASTLLQQLNEVNAIEISNAQLPIKTKRQTLYIQLLINKQPAYGLIDTGAQISLITSALVQHLQLVNADGSNLTQKGHDIIGFNGSRSSTNKLTVILTIGNSTTKRSFRQRLHVIESVSYKLILGCDVLYFWQSCVSIPKQLLQVTTAPQLDLPLFTKEQVQNSDEYRDFIEGQPQVNLAELYEINTVARINNMMDQQESCYLGRELNEVLVGNSSSGTVQNALPTNTRVSFSPIQPFVDSVDKYITLQQAKQLCAQHQLSVGDTNTLPLRAYNVYRALAENPQLINDQLPYQDQCSLLQVLLDVGDVLAFDLSDITEYADFPPMTIDVMSKPIKQKPYRLTQQDSIFVQSEIKLLKDNNMLQDSSSPWLSPTFVVRPSTHRARMVTDYRKLNAVTIKNAYPLPDILQLFDRLAQSRLFTTLDLKSGFYQIKVADESVPLTAMGTDRGLYQFTVVPFGLANAPSHFMNAINHLIQTEQLQDILEAFVDDLCVHTPYDIQQHCLALKKCLLALRNKKHKVAATKIFAGYTLMKLLGHYISNGQVSMDNSKVDAVAQLNVPTTIKQLRAFLGIVGYYRRFIHKFAQKSYHLTQLLKHVDTFTWTPQCQAEFEQLKLALKEAPVLSLPTQQGMYKLYTDYCSYAMSAILHQVDDNNIEKVIQYASKKCQPRESVLSSAEGELLAVVFGLSKFKHYLAGRKFDLITDSAAVTNLKSTRNLNAKMVRWSLLIFDFDFNLIHKSGKKHLNADGLSRASTKASEYDSALQYVENIDTDDSESEAESCTIDVFECSALQPITRSICDTGLAMEKLQCICNKCKQQAQRKQLLNCETCGAQYHPACIQQKRPLHYWHCSECLARISQEGMLDETEHEALQLYLLGKRNFDQQQLDELQQIAQGFSWDHGLLYKINSDNDARIYPGPARRLIIIDELHRRYLHLGANRLYHIAAANYYWPTLQQDIKNLVAHCLPCQLTNTVFRRRERLQGHLTFISAPRQGWSIDLAPELTTNTDLKQSIIVCIDDFSSYVRLGIVDKKSETIAQYVELNIIQQYGAPQYIRTDQGTEFFGSVKKLCAQYGITQKYIERAAPWRNGRAERMMRTTKRMIKAVLNAREVADWPELLPQLQYAINSAPVKSHGFQPFEIFYGKKPPPLIQPHEISGEYKALSTDTAQLPPEQMCLLLQERREAAKKLARQRLKQYQKQIEDQYIGYPIRENALTGEKSICKNAIVAIKNTQRGAWQTSGVGPFLVVDINDNNVTLQSLTTGQIFPEAIENVLPLNMRSGLRSKMLHNVRI